jgi:2'-5' RNA ligase
MQGIVSLLDADSEQAVRSLWDELAREWNLREAARLAPIPHISYHVAEGYDLARIGLVMRRIGADAPPLNVRITGFGEFTAVGPVLYLAIARDTALDSLHASIWKALDDGDIARNSWRLYAPETWVPHVTLAMGDLTAETLASLLTKWSGRDARMEARISAISLFGDGSYTPLEQVELSGVGSAST